MFQKEFKINWKCETQQQVLHQLQGSRTVDSGQPCLPHISNLRAKGGFEPDATFYHKLLSFSTKDIAEPMCRLIDLVIGFQKGSVCDSVIIASAKVLFVKV